VLGAEKPGSLVWGVVGAPKNKDFILQTSGFHTLYLCCMLLGASGVLWDLPEYCW